MSDEWSPDDPDVVRVHYDLSRWSFDQQAELASDLTEAAIPHAWDSNELLVPEEFEIATDTAITLVEERLGIDDAALEAEDSPVGEPEPIELGEDVITTEYDLGEWSDDERGIVGTLLVRQHLPFRWDDHILLVAHEHAGSVETILDAVESGEHDVVPTIDEPDAEAELEAEGEGASEQQLPYETLTTFFLAGERLHKNPLDANGLQELIARPRRGRSGEPALRGRAPAVGADLHTGRRAGRRAHRGGRAGHGGGAGDRHRAPRPPPAVRVATAALGHPDAELQAPTVAGAEPGGRGTHPGLAAHSAVTHRRPSNWSASVSASQCS